MNDNQSQFCFVDWTDDDIAAHLFHLFDISMDTIVYTLSFLIHELAVNEDVQQRLYDEIARTNDTLNGTQITYRSLQSMDYLDMVVSETLRKWPVNIMLDRTVIKEYSLLNGDGSKMTLAPGEIVRIPVWAIHHDPKYYRNPEQFDPDRFSAANRAAIDPMTFLPFGIGPRACISSRFVLLQVKLNVFCLLAKFRVERCNKTEVPLKMRSLSRDPNGHLRNKGFSVVFKLR